MQLNKDMKTIVVFGGAGGIGLWAVKHALKRGYKVVAYARTIDKIKITHNNLKLVCGRIDDFETMVDALEGADAVIWCVGIPLKGGDDNAALKGHYNLIQAMQHKGVKRLIDWSTTSVPFEQDKKSFITIVPALMASLFLPKAKKELIAIAELIRQSTLDWTIVRFLAPKNSPYTGKVKVSFGDKSIKMNISREDIADFMVAQVEDTTYLHSMPIIGS